MLLSAMLGQYLCAHPSNIRLGKIFFVRCIVLINIIIAVTKTNAKAIRIIINIGNINNNYNFNRPLFYNSDLSVF